MSNEWKRDKESDVASLILSRWTQNNHFWSSLITVVEHFKMEYLVARILEQDSKEQLETLRTDWLAKTKKCHLDGKVVKVVRDPVVQVSIPRPLDIAKFSHECIVKHCTPGLLSEGIKPSTKRHKLSVMDRKKSISTGWSLSIIGRLKIINGCKTSTLWFYFRCRPFNFPRSRPLTSAHPLPIRLTPGVGLVSLGHTVLTLAHSLSSVLSPQSFWPLQVSVVLMQRPAKTEN